jgi:hypothetical protein
MPLGSEPRAVTPPLQVFPQGVPTQPLPAAARAVERYDETSRTIQAADINPVDAGGKPVDAFAKISKELYNSEDYGEALKLWNRYHPRASETMRSEGRLVAGDRLYVPPVAMLEKRYGSVIPAKAKAGAAASPSDALPASFPPPPSTPAPPR